MNIKKLTKITIPVLLALLDQLIKYIVVSFMNLGQVKNITSFIYITYVENSGAAFSMLEDNRLFLVITGLITLGLIILYTVKNKDKSKLEKTALTIITGGIIGNLIDRILKGYIVDYIGVYIFNYSFPIFNLADILIVVGAGLIIGEIIFGGKNEINS